MSIDRKGAVFGAGLIAGVGLLVGCSSSGEAAPDVPTSPTLTNSYAVSPDGLAATIRTDEGEVYHGTTLVYCLGRVGLVQDTYTNKLLAVTDPGICDDNGIVRAEQEPVPLNEIGVLTNTVKITQDGLAATIRTDEGEVYHGTVLVSCIGDKTLAKQDYTGQMVELKGSTVCNDGKITSSDLSGPM